MFQLAILAWICAELSAPTWVFCCWTLCAAGWVIKLIAKFAKLCAEVDKQ